MMIWSLSVSTVVQCLLASFFILLFSDQYLMYKFGLPIIPSHFFTLFILMLFFFLLFTKKISLSYPFLFFFFFCSLFIIAFSLPIYAEIRESVNLILHMMLVYAIYKLSKWLPKGNKTSLIIMLFAGFFSLLFLAEGLYSNRRLISSPSGNPTQLAGLLAPVIIFAGFLFVSYKSTLKRGIILLCLCVLCYALLLTQGRNAMFSIALAFFLYNVILSVYSLTERRFKVDLKRVFLLVLLLLFLVSFRELILYMDEKFDFEGDASIHRIARTMNADVDASSATAGRTDLWAYYLKQYDGVDIVGIGGARYSNNDNVLSPHNMFIRLYVETTVFGLFFFLVLYIISFWKIVSSGSKTSLVLLIFSFALCFANDVLYSKYWWFTVFLIAYLSSSQSSKSEFSCNESK